MTAQPAQPAWPAQLHDLALDLRWSWRPEIRALFQSIDPRGRLTEVPANGLQARVVVPARIGALEAATVAVQPRREPVPGEVDRGPLALPLIAWQR